MYWDLYVLLRLLILLQIMLYFGKTQFITVLYSGGGVGGYRDRNITDVI